MCDAARAGEENFACPILSEVSTCQGGNERAHAHDVLHDSKSGVWRPRRSFTAVLPLHHQDLLVRFRQGKGVWVVETDLSSHPIHPLFIDYDGARGTCSDLGTHGGFVGPSKLFGLGIIAIIVGGTGESRSDGIVIFQTIEADDRMRK